MFMSSSGRMDPEGQNYRSQGDGRPVGNARGITFTWGLVWFILIITKPSEVFSPSSCFFYAVFLHSFFLQKMTIWVNEVNRVICVWVRMSRMEEVHGHGLCTANRPAGRAAGRPARWRNILRSFSDRTPQYYSTYFKISLVDFQNWIWHYMAPGAPTNVTRPRSGFYLRNEFRAAGIRLHLHKRCMVFVLLSINWNVSATVKTFLSCARLFLRI